MQYTVITTSKFKKDIEYYKKKKKFTNVTEDIKSIVEELEHGNLLGKDISDIEIPSNDHVYKVRIANSNTKVGKSNGYRMIYYVVKDDQEIYLLTIYYKKDDKNVLTKQEISGLIKNCLFC